MDALLDPIRDLTGGGTLTIWTVVGAVAALLIAMKVVRFVMKMIFLGVGIALLVSTAPWSGEALDGPVAECASTAVEHAVTWQTAVSKRTTVEELSDDAACNADDTGLAQGTAVVKLRTFYDIPFQTWDVDSSGADARLDVDDLPRPSSS